MVKFPPFPSIEGDVMGCVDNSQHTLSNSKCGPCTNNFSRIWEHVRNTQS
jgi:hypothetical protein